MRSPHTVVAAICLGMLAGPAMALEPAPFPAVPNLPNEQSVAAPFTPWVGADVAILGEQDEVGRGQECPTNSGSYCSDQFPVCCLIGNDYRCHASLADCGR